jgi:hypothetical protein
LEVDLTELVEIQGRHGAMYLMPVNLLSGWNFSLNNKTIGVAGNEAF